MVVVCELGHSLTYCTVLCDYKHSFLSEWCLFVLAVWLASGELFTAGSDSIMVSLAVMLETLVSAGRCLFSLVAYCGQQEVSSPKNIHSYVMWIKTSDFLPLLL